MGDSLETIDWIQDPSAPVEEQGPSGLNLLLMSNVLGVLRGARLYIAGYAKQRFLHSAVSAC